MAGVTDRSVCPCYELCTAGPGRGSCAGAKFPSTKPPSSSKQVPRQAPGLAYKFEIVLLMRYSIPPENRILDVLALTSWGLFICAWSTKADGLLHETSTLILVLRMHF